MTLEGARLQPHTMTIPKLFAVYLGGRAPRCNTELHDVVFVTGSTIEDTYDQLLAKWFGSPQGLHLDSWTEIDVVDGYRVSLSATAPVNPSETLFFVNLGAYGTEDFTEYHSNRFVVAANAAEAKAHATRELSRAGLSGVHKDYLHEVDDCIQVATVDALHVVLTKTDEASAARPVNAYHVVPKAVIAAFVARTKASQTGR
jgi:hypothetical protein